MKQKLFTLLTLLLSIVGGANPAWATDIFSLNVTRTTNLSIAYQATYTLTASDATMVGGSAEIYNAKSGNPSEVISSGSYINLAGSGSSYIHITLDANHILQAGDVITFTTIEAKTNLFISKTTSKGNSKTLTLSDTNVYTYTLGGSDDLIGATELYIFKDGLRYIKAITITGSGNSSDFALTSSADINLATSATSQIGYTSSSTGAVTYTSSNTSVATVSETGLITGVAIGFATITVSQEADASYRAGGATIAVNVQNTTTHTGEWVLDTENGSRSSKTYTTADGALKFTLGGAGDGNATYNDLKDSHFKHSGDITFTLPSNYSVSSVWFVGYRNTNSGTATITLKKVDEADVTVQSGTIGGNDAIPTADCVGFELESAATKSMVINISGESRGYFILNPAAQNISLTQVGSNYYASYYSAGEVTISGATAYTAELNADKNKLILTECAGGVVGGRTGVILIGNSASATATPSFTGAATKQQGDLIGAAQKPVSMTSYYNKGNISSANSVFVLGIENSKAGLYKYTGSSLGVNKAYLYNETLASQGARALTFDFGGSTTAINGVNAETVKAELKKYFENGQIVIEKNGIKYNAAGQQLK